MAAQGRWAEISGLDAHPLLRRLLALGLPRGRRLVGTARLARRSAAAGRSPSRRERAGRATPPSPRPERRPSWRRPHDRASAIYEGWVAHRRRSPVEHAFRYRIFLPLLDLDELPELLDTCRCGPPAAGARAVPPLRLPRRPSVPLAEAARDLVAERIGRRPAGPVRLLANPRYLGVGFNPVALLLPLRRGGASVEAMIAEVTNTPWGERSPTCSTAARASATGTIRGELRQAAARLAVHADGAELRDARSASPASDLAVAIRNHEAGGEVFDASLALRRRELTRARSRGLLAPLPADDDRDPGPDLLATRSS